MGQVTHLVRTLPTTVADDLKAVGAAVRARRVARQETQEALAQRLGLSLRTLRDVEKGAPTVSVGAVFGVIWALGLRAEVQDALSAKPAELTGPTKVGRPTVRKGEAPDDF